MEGVLAAIETYASGRKWLKAFGGNTARHRGDGSLKGVEDWEVKHKVCLKTRG